MIMGLQSRVARAPLPAAGLASAWLAMLSVSGDIPILLSRYARRLYDSGAARGRTNSINPFSPREGTRNSHGGRDTDPAILARAGDTR